MAIAEMPADTATENGAVAHRTATVESVRLHYAIAGSGPLLVLLHGWPQTWYEWHRLMPPLARHYTVVAPDLSGAGLSDKPLAGYDKLTLARDIRGLVAQLGRGAPVIVGHDIGGMVAYAYATEFEAETRGMAILDVPVPGIPPWDEAVRDPRVWHFAFHAQRDLAEKLVEGRERLYLAQFFRDRAHNVAAVSDADIDVYARAYAAPGALRAGFEYYRTFAADEARNRAAAQRRLRIPVMGLGGARRWGPRMQELVDAIAENGTGHSIAECGHWLAEEQPEAVLRHLLAFAAPL